MTLDGDRAKLEQVLRNFLSNALKFTPNDGRVEVTVTVLENENLPQGNNNIPGNRQTFLRIQVIDNGPGIAKVSVNSSVEINIFANLYNLTDIT